jgi:hypothetical protein
MRRQTGVLAGILFMAAGCASTQLATTWKDPSYSGALPKKVLVVAFVPSQTTQEEIQTQLAAKLRDANVQAIPVSQYVTPGTTVSRDTLDRVIKEGHFDGLMVSRYRRTTETVNYVPGAAWDWGGYYSLYGPYAPGYWSVTPQVHMETSLFDATKGENGHLIWSGTSATTESGANGTSISNKDIAHYAAVIVGRLHKDISG